MYYSIYSPVSSSDESPVFGDLLLTANEDGLTSLTFCNGKKQVEIDPTWQINDAAFEQVNSQLDEYFAGERSEFSLKLAPQGTPFQKKVWQALQTIKRGETKSYAWLAEKINNKKAVRAVGTANGANPIGLIIPCHRVIGSDGKLTGYAGGLGLKAKLLMHEGAQFKP